MTEPLAKIIPLIVGRMRPISDKEDARRKAAWQSIIEAKRREEITENANRRCVPASKAIRDIILQDKPKQTAMFTRCVNRGFNRPGMPDLLFCLGGTGTGKTTGLAWLVARHPLTALYVTAPQVCEPRNAGTYALLDAVRTVNLLAIDELGLEAKPSVLVELLIHRYDNGLITVLAGNLTKSQLGERYSDARLRSRAIAIGRDVIIELGEDDLRAQR